MARRSFQFVVITLVLVASFAPLIDTFDTWDHSPVPSCDTELQIAAVAVGIGVVITLAKLSRFSIEDSTIGTVVRDSVVLLQSSEERLCIPTASPPILGLRI